MKPLPEMHLYRHPEIQTCRPYGFDVDADGWLWEGQQPDTLYAHNIHTAEARCIPLPKVRGQAICDLKCFGGKLVMATEYDRDYVVYDPRTETAECHAAPGKAPNIWYMTRLPDERLVLFERSEGRLLILDEPDGKARVVKSPFGPGAAGGCVRSDGLLYMNLPDPARIVRFDPAKNRFLDEIPCPVPEAALSGSVEYDGTIYISDSPRGRLLTFDIEKKAWGDSVPIPGHGKVFGYAGGAVEFNGMGCFSLSTYRFASRLDLKTGKLITPEGAEIGVDGRPHRFLGSQLLFDPESRSFDFLTVPEQPDGIPLVCYQWSDGRNLILTGYIIPFGTPGDPSWLPGDWIVWQSTEATEEPGYDRYNFGFDKKAHIDKYRRTIPLSASLYIPHPECTPPVANMEGYTVSYQEGEDQRLKRRAARTDANGYRSSILDRLVRPGMTEAEIVREVLVFVSRNTYYNPLREIGRGDNTWIRVLESHDTRCGDAAAVIAELLGGAGIKSRITGLNHHVIAEAFYDGAWHACDALFFGGNQVERDGRVLSVEELEADPYYADAWPQESFVFDPECMRTLDGYYQLGYNFGEWGWEPYYSYYLHAEYDTPPSLPMSLPAVRLAGKSVRLRWVESLKKGGGPVEYHIGVYADRKRTQLLFEALTETNSVDWEVPEMNRMYFTAVKAMDDHRKKNPDTWYPVSPGNFVLVPEDQYGWYGVF